MPTFGLEIELQGLGRAALSGIDFIRFDVHDDGSVRGPTYTVDGLPILFRHNDRSTGAPIIPSGCGEWRGDSIGLELVTRPYEYEELRGPAQQLADYLGHIPQTPRTSIHIHVDVANKSWRYIQNLIRWCYWLEAPLMRLAAGNSGQVHRGARIYAGEYNDYRYARPLSDPIGLPWVSTGRERESALIVMDRLLAANTASEMVSHWGRMDLYWSSGISHYVPHRLHMINLVSVQRIGTLEWRLFDAVYSKLPLFIDLVAAIHRVAEDYSLRPEDVHPVPVLLNDADSHAGFSIQRLSAMLDLDLEPLWGKVWMPGTRQKLRRSHYQDMSLSSFARQPLVLIENNEGVRDKGGDDFHLFYRQQPRQRSRPRPLEQAEQPANVNPAAVIGVPTPSNNFVLQSQSGLDTSYTVTTGVSSSSNGGGGWTITSVDSGPIRAGTPVRRLSSDEQALAEIQRVADAADAAAALAEIEFERNNAAVTQEAGVASEAAFRAELLARFQREQENIAAGLAQAAEQRAESTTESITGRFASEIRPTFTSPTGRRRRS
jgi:hypothetical protein